MELWSLLSITAPGLFPNPERFRGLLRAADREAAATPSCSPSCAAGSSRWSCAAPRSRSPPTCRRSRSRYSRSSCTRGTASSTRPTCSASGRRSSACSTTSTTTGSRSCARSPCCASCSLHAALVDEEHADVPSREDRRAARAARGRGRRRPPGAGVQPVHRFLRHGARRGSRRPGSSYCYLDGTTTQPGGGDRGVQGRAPRRSS